MLAKKEEINAIAMLTLLFQEGDAILFCEAEAAVLVFCQLCRNITSAAVK